MWSKISKIMIYHNSHNRQVRPVSWWHPWANTIAYYTLNWDADDYYGNYNWTWWNWANYATWFDWNQCADFSWSNSTWVTSSCTTAPKTLSLFMKWISLTRTSKDRRQLIWMTTTFEWWDWRWFRAIPTKYNQSTIDWSYVICAGWSWQTYKNTSIVDTNWHHYCFVSDNNATKFYFDWNLLTTFNWEFTNPSNKNLVFWQQAALNVYESNTYMQYIILESVAWSQQDITDYLSNFTY